MFVKISWRWVLLAGPVGGRALCWLEGLLAPLLSVACRMLLMMVWLSREEPGGTEEDEDEDEAGLLTGGWPPNSCCCCCWSPLCRSSRRSSNSLVWDQTQEKDQILGKQYLKNEKCYVSGNLFFGSGNKQKLNHWQKSNITTINLFNYTIINKLHINCRKSRYIHCEVYKSIWMIP